MFFTIYDVSRFMIIFSILLFINYCICSYTDDNQQDYTTKQKKKQKMEENY